MVNNAFYVLSAGGDCPLEVIVIYHLENKELRFLCFSAFLSYTFLVLAYPPHRTGEEPNLLDMEVVLGSSLVVLRLS